MIKIFYMTTDSKIGGTERMLLSLLGRLDKSKYAPFACAIKSGGPLIEEMKKMGVRGECLMRQPGAAGRFIEFILIPFKFAILLKKEKPDILHTFLFHANILGRIVGRLSAVPVIISSQRSIDNWRKPRHSLLDRWTSGLCNLIISNSEAGRNILIERDNISPRKIITIPNGIDVNNFDAAADAAERKKFGLEPDDAVIGIIANLRRVKGHRYLFEALAGICSGKVYPAGSGQAVPPRIKALVVGDGRLREELEGTAEKLGIKNRVVFTGFQKEVARILKIIDIFVLPSLWEGFPVSILEAMASNKPVIASRVGGIPEEVVDGETGLLVSPGDARALGEAILKLINAPEKAERMGTAGRKRVEEYFTLDKMTGKTEDVYDRFMQAAKIQKN